MECPYNKSQGDQSDTTCMYRLAAHQDQAQQIMCAAPEAILFPANLVEQAQPFSIDFGGSVIKIAYKLDNEMPNEDGMSYVYLHSFPRAQLSEALTFIHDTVPLPTTGGQQTITMTGIGISEYASMIEDEIGMKVKNIWEGLCINRMFRYLVTTQDDEQLFFPTLSIWDKSIDLLVEQTHKTAKGLISKNQAQLKAWDYSGHRRWPCLNVGLGSGFSFNAMMENGDEMVGMYNPYGGRSFYGLGCLLTGAKSFEELVSLAEAGDDHSINTYLKDMHMEDPSTRTEGNEKAEKTGDVFSTMNRDINIYAYGWAIGKNITDYKRENLARALLNNVCAGVVQYCLLVAGQLQITNIILAGGFAMNPFIRSLLERDFLKSKALGAVFQFNSMFGDTTFRTLKAGIHLAVLGAMFVDVDLGNMSVKTEVKTEVSPDTADLVKTEVSPDTADLVKTKVSSDTPDLMP